MNNVSSLILNILEDKKDYVKKECANLGLNIEEDLDSKLIVVVLTSTLDEELALFKQIEQIDGVISVSLAFTYQELKEQDDYLNNDLDSMAKAMEDKVNALSDEASSIRYYGSEFRKF